MEWAAPLIAGTLCTGPDTIAILQNSCIFKLRDILQKHLMVLLKMAKSSKVEKTEKLLQIKEAKQA